MFGGIETDTKSASMFGGIETDTNRETRRVAATQCSAVRCSFAPTQEDLEGCTKVLVVRRRRHRGSRLRAISSQRTAQCMRHAVIRRAPSS